MNLIAIDPGAEGACAVFKSDIDISIYDMPTVIENDNILVDVKALYEIVLAAGPEIEAAVEHLHDYQVSKFQKAKDVQWINYGRVLAVLELAPNVQKLHRVVPRSWQTSARKKKLDSKPESIEKAIEFYPHLKKQLLNAGSKDTYNHNRCEAVLIGHHIFKQAEGKALGRRKKDK